LIRVESEQSWASAAAGVLTLEQLDALHEQMIIQFCTDYNRQLNRSQWDWSMDTPNPFTRSARSAFLFSMSLSYPGLHALEREFVRDIEK